MSAVEALENLFSEQGELSRHWPGFEVRPEQQAFAGLIQSSLVGRRSMLIEAPTGTGKTLGYLLPLMLGHDKAIISVGNRTLQDHLWWGEYQKLQLFLPKGKSIGLLKGCENYLCPNQLQSSLEAGEPVLLNHWKEIQQWHITTRDGEIRTLPLTPQQLQQVRPKLSIQADRCLGSQCSWFDQCHFQKARQNAAESELLLINHSLLLSDQQLFRKGLGALLPPASVVVVDEAHQLPDMLLRHNMDMLDGYKLFRWQKRFRRRMGAGIHLYPDLARLLYQLERVWQQIEQQLGPQLEQTARLTVSAAGLKPLLVLLNRLLKTVQAAKVTLDVDEGMEAVELLQSWVNLLQRGIDEGGVFYGEKNGDHLRLQSARLQSPFTGLDSAERTWLFLSATLAVDNRFDYVRQVLSLPDLAAKRFELAMDYQNRAALWMPSELPEPGEETFYPAWVDTVLTLDSEIDGGILMLFSSHQALQEAAKQIPGKTDRAVLVYHPDADRQQLLQQFRQDTRSILLATGSFWEGIDVQGAALRCVAIDKLPFAPPDDLMSLAWHHLAREQGLHWFNDFAVPQAITRLRQGVGRLLRASGDSGLVVLGDRRVLTRAYGPRFLSSLPRMPHLHSMDAVTEFLQQQGIQLSKQLR